MFLHRRYEELRRAVVAAESPLPSDLVHQVAAMCVELRSKSFHLEATRLEVAASKKRAKSCVRGKQETDNHRDAYEPISVQVPVRVKPHTRRELAVQSLATRLADYSVGVGSAVSTETVSSWLDQFDFCDQTELIEAVDRVFARWYLSERVISENLSKVVVSKKLAGSTPLRDFWSRLSFLHIQRKGQSQTDMLDHLDRLLQRHVGLSIHECRSTTGTYIYLDDCIFSGTHVWTDLVDWIRSPVSPARANIRVFSVARYNGAESYANWRVREEAQKYGKEIQISEWRSCLTLHNDVRQMSLPDVLHPSQLPSTSDYLKLWLSDLSSHGVEPKLREVPTSSVQGAFPTAHDRAVLESAFFEAGIRIKYGLCKTLKQNHWPLGYDLPKSRLFNGFGFGALLVTYRNCPNNCPLALWAGSPWKPLFPRRANPAFQNIDPAIFDLPSL